MYVLLSRTQAGPGRTVKQEQEEISRNHVQTFISPSVCELISDVIFGCPRTTDNIVNRPGENGTAGLREFPFMALLGYDKNKYETRLHDILTQ